jgi:hypothetical protein
MTSMRANAKVGLDGRLPDQNGSGKYDFSDIAGKLSWRGDAVAEQRRIRDEW